MPEDSDSTNAGMDVNPFFGVISANVQSFKTCRRYLNTRSHPSRTCRDLKQVQPNVTSGYYWIDPNEGPPDDAVKVYCDFPLSATCIYPNKSKTGNKKWFSGNDGYKWFAKEFDDRLQFAYDCDPIQLTFLRLLSNHAKQTITYHCLNSTAWFREGSGNYEHSIRLKADNGIEIHAKGTRKYKPTVVLDECQIKDGTWRKTVIEMNTSKTHRLPIHDVAVYDIGDSGEEFGLEIGPVCFS